MNDLRWEGGVEGRGGGSLCPHLNIKIDDHLHPEDQCSDALTGKCAG